MSVAFRRESDDEHLEPKFELPIPPGPNLVTERGLALIAARVEALEAELAGLSDENEIKRVKRDLRYWRTRQATAQLKPVPEGAAVAFGSTVTFRMGGKERTVTLVGDDEADPAAGLLSFTAPLSRALMEAEVGDEIDFGGKPGAILVLEVGD
jgi:transcription elongation GreA/GreB family factor